MDSLKKMFKNLPSKIFYFCFDGFLPINGLIFSKIYNKKTQQIIFLSWGQAGKYEPTRSTEDFPKDRLFRSYVIFALKALIFIINCKSEIWMEPVLTVSQAINLPHPPLESNDTSHKSSFSIMFSFFQAPLCFSQVSLGSILWGLLKFAKFEVKSRKVIL